jgi:hypothetical protein
MTCNMGEVECALFASDESQIMGSLYTKIMAEDIDQLKNNYQLDLLFVSTFILVCYISFTRLNRPLSVELFHCLMHQPKK